MSETMYYVGYREILEKPGRNGYTVDPAEAGKFTLEEAKSMTRFECAHGYVRWFIPCSALDSFNGKSFHPKEIY